MNVYKEYNKVIKSIIFLMLLSYQAISQADSCFIYEIHDKTTKTYDSSGILCNKIDKALQKNGHGFLLTQKYKRYRIYKYFDIYYLLGYVHGGSFSTPYNLFYYPKNDSISSTTHYKAYQYYKDKEISTIEDVRDLLEHLLLISGGCILEDLDILSSRYKINLDSIGHIIQFTKPKATKYLKFDKYVYFVFNRPNQGGTIYKYEIPVCNKRICGSFTVDEMYCFGDEWYLE